MSDHSRGINDPAAPRPLSYPFSGMQTTWRDANLQLEESRFQIEHEEPPQSAKSAGKKSADEPGPSSNENTRAVLVVLGAFLAIFATFGWTSAYDTLSRPRRARCSLADLKCRPLFFSIDLASISHFMRPNSHRRLPQPSLSLDRCKTL
jgi:hypothetical protein